MDRITVSAAAGAYPVLIGHDAIDSLARHYKISTGVPWRDLPKKIRDVFLHGSGATAQSMIPLAFRFQ